MFPGRFLFPAVIIVLDTFSSVGFIVRSFSPGISLSFRGCSVATLSSSIIMLLLLGSKVRPLIKVANADTPLARLRYGLFSSPAGAVSAEYAVVAQ